MPQEPLWFVFREEQLLIYEFVYEESPVRVPLVESLEDLGLNTVYRREIGDLDGRECMLATVAPDTEPPDGMVFRDLRSLLAGMEQEFFGMAGRAKQVAAWHTNHRFCGRCGSETRAVSGEMAKRCPLCGMTYYPRLSPAVIVMVRRGEKILLARSPGFAKGLYSVLAGFVEPGESMEQTIRREVREEVGIEVDSIRYFGSQPWPFPHSLMVGFTARWAGGEIRVADDELVDAGWYAADSLPPVPGRISIARRLIDWFSSEFGSTAY